jgi:hypothetical protein
MKERKYLLVWDGWKDDIKKDCNEIGCHVLDCIQVT